MERSSDAAEPVDIRKLRHDINNTLGLIMLLVRQIGRNDQDPSAAASLDEEVRRLRDQLEMLYSHLDTSD